MESSWDFERVSPRKRALDFSRFTLYSLTGEVSSFKIHPPFCLAQSAGDRLVEVETLVLVT